MTQFLFPLLTASSIILTLMTVILLIVAGLMVFLIMLQEGKSGGLAALGGTSASATMGVSNPLRRGTAYLAIILFILSVIINIAGKKGLDSGEDIKELYDQDPTEMQEPAPSGETKEKGLTPAGSLTPAAPVEPAIPSTPNPSSSSLAAPAIN